MLNNGPLTSVLHLMDYLRIKYLEDRKERAATDKPMAEPTIEDFVDFSKVYLTKLPAVNPTYLLQGLGLTLANGDVVSLLEQPKNELPMRDTGVHVTKPPMIPGQHGISDTSGIEITGAVR